MKRFCLINIATLLLLVTPPVQGSDSFVILVNSEVTQSNLNRKELRNLFTLKKRVWQDGTSVQLVTLPPNHEQHQAFVRAQLKLFPYQVRRLWDRQVFSGSAKSPKQAEDFDEIVLMTANTKGAISYVSASKVRSIDNDKVKILTIN